ncbi:hypothetical protein ACR777_05425 [Sphingobacterium spiritivorum]|uniref:hypothetical protein n=1 Tax=Sphingobacterium spiritivorum TaxID=258 RepID=UPI003DA5C16A
MAKVDAKQYKEWQEYCIQVQRSTTVKLQEPPEVKDQRKKLALKDYNYFVKTYFPIYADSDCGYFHIEAANAILKDPNIFAAIEWPREHAKTVHMCLIIPMWLMIHGELDGMILMSRTLEMAANALGDIQAHLQYNNLFISDWGEKFNYGDWADGDFTTRDGIRFLALGRGQAPQGARKGEKRPNYGVCSDLDDYEIVNNERRVLQVVNVILGALMNALAIKGSRLIVENNRIHPRGILAHIVGDITPQTPKREGLYHNVVYATEKGKHKKAYISEGGEPAWKERYTKEQLSRRFKKLGPTITSAEFYHEHSIQGKIFKNEYIRFKKMAPLRQYIVLIGYFDPSFENNPKSDFKAVRVWGGIVNKAQAWERHCLKSFVRRTELIEAFRFMSRYEDTLPAGVAVIWYVEKQFFNRPIQDALNAHNQQRKKDRKKQLIISTDYRIKENKYTRIVRMEPMYTNNEVYFNIDEQHDPDMIEGNNQLKGIEAGYSGPDDSPDADEGDWYYLDQHIPARNFEPIIERHQNNNGW